MRRQRPVDSASLYLAWKTTGHSAELHICSKGGHAFGAKPQGLPVDYWINALGDGLALQAGFTSAEQTPRTLGRNA